MYVETTFFSSKPRKNFAGIPVERRQTMRKKPYEKVTMTDWLGNRWYDDYELQQRHGLNPPVKRGRKPMMIAYLTLMMRIQQFTTTVKNDEDFSISSPTIQFWFSGRLGFMTVMKYRRFFMQQGIIEVIGQRGWYNSAYKSNIYHVHMDKAYAWLKEYANITSVDLDCSMMPQFFRDSKQYYQTKFTLAKLKSMDPEEQAVFYTVQAQKQAKAAKQQTQLLQDNQPFLTMMSQLDTYGLQMRYLNEGSHRLTNPICYTHNEQHADSTRVADIQRLWQTTTEIEEFDTNASIYRLSYLLGHRTPCSHDVDIYRDVFERCRFTYDGAWEDIRADFKQLFMPIYMRESSLRWTSIGFEYMRHWTFFKNNAQREQVQFYESLLTRLHCNTLYELMDRVRCAMHDYLNMKKFYRADIFIHESNLHILMLQRFQQLGLKVIDVYDGFYFEKGKMTQQLFNDVYDQCSMQLLQMMDTIERNKKKHAKRQTNQARTVKSQPVYA